MSYKYTEKEVIDIIKHKNDKVKFIKRETITSNNKCITVITMMCECGEIFTKSFDKITYDKFLLCNKCAQNKAKENRRKKERKKYLINLNKRGYKLIDNSAKMRANTFIDVEDSNGYRGLVYPNTKNKFLPFSPHHNKKWFIYNCNLLAKKNNVASRVIKILPKEPNKTVRVEAICECGRIFTTTYRAFAYGTKQHCEICKKNSSSYEYKVMKFLKDNNISFIREFVINSCKDINPLPFDFWLKDYNVLIEVDGEQHYKPVKFNNISTNEAIRNFKQRQRVDGIKSQYCSMYKIPLLRIPYWNIKNNKYKQQILNIIKAE